MISGLFPCRCTQISNYDCFWTCNDCRRDQDLVCLLLFVSPFLLLVDMEVTVCHPKAWLSGLRVNADMIGQRKKVQCSFSKVGYQLGRGCNLRESPTFSFVPVLISRTILMYVFLVPTYDEPLANTRYRDSQLIFSFLTLEQLKKGIDGYRASGGTLL